MADNIGYGTIIFATLMVFIIGALVIVGLDSYMSKSRKRIFVIIIILTFVLMMQNFVDHFLRRYYVAIEWRPLVSFIGYSVRPLIIMLFAYLIAPKGKHFIAWGLVGFNALMHSTAFYSHLVFYFNENNKYIKGPLYFLCFLISAILLAYLIVLLILKYKKEKIKVREIFFHLFWISIIIFGIVADIIWNDASQWVDYVTIAIVASVVFSYLYFHQQFVREYEMDMAASQRIKIMLSQIQPHFIYNTLVALSEMEGVPDKAHDEIINFSKYLRENLDSLTGADVIPFEKELSHVEKYVGLEQLRFGEKVKVDFDIKVKDFFLPPLTVQVLVENAIKHGITKKYEGGTVTVSTEKSGNNFVIEVKDDGVGFDVTKPLSDEHIGISSIRNRLTQFVGGTLSVESTIGEGTTATVIIPDNAKETTGVKK